MGLAKIQIHVQEKRGNKVIVDYTGAHYWWHFTKLDPGNLGSAAWEIFRECKPMYCKQLGAFRIWHKICKNHPGSATESATKRVSFNWLTKCFNNSW